MPAIPVTKEKCSNLRYKHLDNFTHFKNKGLVPFCIAELPKIVTNYPIVFTKLNDVFSINFITSFSPNLNLFIDGEGKWIGNYIPAIYRSMPFMYTSVKKNEKMVLSFIEELECVISNDMVNKGYNNFYEGKELSKAFKETVNLTNSLNENLNLTLQICKKLNNSGLLTEWPLKIKFKDDEKEIKGLFKIDSEKLFDLNEGKKRKSDNLDRNMLQLAYAQIFSVNNLEKIAALYSGASLDKSDIKKNKSLRDQVLERQEQENSAEMNQLVKNLISDE